MRVILSSFFLLVWQYILLFVVILKDRLTMKKLAIILFSFSIAFGLSMRPDVTGASSNMSQASAFTPVSSLTPISTFYAPPNPATPMDVSCPIGHPPIGWGTVTPAPGWLSICAVCVPTYTPYPTLTGSNTIECEGGEWGCTQIDADTLMYFPGDVMPFDTWGGFGFVEDGTGSIPLYLYYAYDTGGYDAKDPSEVLYEGSINVGLTDFGDTYTIDALDAYDIIYDYVIEDVPATGAYGIRHEIEEGYTQNFHCSKVYISTHPLDLEIPDCGPETTPTPSPSGFLRLDDYAGTYGDGGIISYPMDVSIPEGSSAESIYFSMSHTDTTSSNQIPGHSMVLDITNIGSSSVTLYFSGNISATSPDPKYPWEDDGSYYWWDLVTEYGEMEGSIEDYVEVSNLIVGTLAPSESTDGGIHYEGHFLYDFVHGYTVVMNGVISSVPISSPSTPTPAPPTSTPAPSSGSYCDEVGDWDDDDPPWNFGPGPIIQQDCMTTPTWDYKGVVAGIASVFPLFSPVVYLVDYLPDYVINPVVICFRQQEFSLVLYGVYIPLIEVLAGGVLLSALGMWVQAFSGIRGLKSPSDSGSAPFAPRGGESSGPGGPPAGLS